MEIGKLLLYIVCSLVGIIVIADVICRLIDKQQGICKTELFKISYVKKVARYTCELRWSAKRKLRKTHGKNITVYVYGDSIDEVIRYASEELREKLK